MAQGMRDILVFGGTAEGRMLVEWLDGRGTCQVVACTATEYGASLLEGGAHVQAIQGPLSSDQKAQLVAAHDFACIVDATHPYATHISESIAALAREHNIDLVRIARADSALEEDAFASVCTVVASAEEAAHRAAQTQGNILLTTGSKDLDVFTANIPSFEQRLYARVLPVPESLARTQKLGIPNDHVIAMQGPFSTAFNCALIREHAITCMVTKQSGASGGFGEKVAAAQECGTELVVVARPDQASGGDGLSLEEAKTELEKRYGF